MLTRYDSDKPSEIVIEVSDTGTGIPKELVGKIFDPFFTTKSAGGGTGLGLSISHTIIQKLGGKIAVVSSTEAGAVIAIRLPVV
jgi:two-component system NtrC family sensor kinase